MNENKATTTQPLYFIDAFVIRHIIFITFNYAFELFRFFFIQFYCYFGDGGAKNDVEFISDRSF